MYRMKSTVISCPVTLISSPLAIDKYTPSSHLEPNIRNLQRTFIPLVRILNVPEVPRHALKEHVN
jgi:hypothetical protein